MNLLVFYLFFAIVAVILIAGYFNSKQAVIKRKLRKAVVKKLTEFKDGETAKIVGTVEITDVPLLSPLSRRKCAYYYVHIEQQVSTGKSTSWKTIIEEEVSGKFVIRDGINCAYINENYLKSYIVQDRKYNSGFLNDPTPQLEEFLASKGFSSENILGFNKRLRYKEGILENNERIAVYGKGIWKNVDVLNLPKKYGRVLEISSTENEAVYISDDPGTTEKTNENIAVKKDKLVKDRKNYKMNERRDRRMKEKKMYKRYSR